jgi:hypothetical protein
VANIVELRSLLARVSATTGPSRALDQDIAGVLLSADAVAPPWSASTEEAKKLFKQLLQQRPMDLVHDADRGQYICTVKLYGNMPATAPYVVRLAKTAPVAILAALIETLIAVELDYWS